MKRLLNRFYSRNIGIIAHIDAGKTTTTERMLYFSGTTKRLGDVDHGDTITDFLPAERERGITIQSAAISFEWNKMPINLIDTPGHADFTFEVIRSLRVLDGAVTVLDAVAGVEAQTEKVWSQAAALGIPRMVYINKMDRAGAGFSRTVREVVSKLHTQVALLNLPYFENDEFKGVTDVLNQKTLVWDGEDIDVRDAEGNDAIEARQAIIDTLADLDDNIVDLFIEQDGDYSKIPNETLQSAIRKATIANKLVPVMCGSSFKNIGVQPLLDGIVDYLPDPSIAESKAVTALAFKVTQDPIRGPLSFVRVYSGSLKKGTMFYNTNTKTKERASQLLQMQADKPIEIAQIKAGGIGVIAGSEHVNTGDTLVAHPTKKDGVNQLSANDKNLALLPIEVPPPVFMTRISPKNAGDKRSMDNALNILLREDPSLQISYDEENGQWLLAGMGELHLEIAQDRLVNDLKANVEVGEIMITLKETVTVPIAPQTASSSVDGNVSVNVAIAPQEHTNPNLGDLNSITVKSNKHPFLSRDLLMQKSIVGVMPVIAKGGKLARAALRGLSFKVDINISPETQSADMVASLVREAAQACIASLDPHDFTVLEPFMNVTISAPQDEIGTVMTDISSTRRGNIVSMGEVETTEHDSRFRELADSVFVPEDHTMYMSKHEQDMNRPTSVQAVVPLRAMIGYLSSLRGMTHGRGSFTMSFDTYEPVPPQDLQQVLS